MLEGFRVGGSQIDTAYRIHSIFIAAGVPAPRFGAEPWTRSSGCRRRRRRRVRGALRLPVFRRDQLQNDTTRLKPDKSPTNVDGTFWGPARPVGGQMKRSHVLIVDDDRISQKAWRISSR